MATVDETSPVVEDALALVAEFEASALVHAVDETIFANET